mmetsp:Transcript_19619/g.54058  ORF Transcript_19619/g.54058 Transcript_19619/m.54058 type:complete len:331 (-) Transcript_19619:507-1499(-)
MRSSSSLLIPDRCYFILPCGASLLPWLGIILSLTATLSSTFKRSIEYLEGDESLSFALLDDSNATEGNEDNDGMALNSNHPYPYRYMVATYVNPWSYLDDGVPLNPDDDSPYFPYPFDTNNHAHMRLSGRFLIAAIVLALLAAVATMVAWCRIDEGPSGLCSGSVWHNSLVGWMSLVLIAVTSFVNQIPTGLLKRSETLCLEENQVTLFPTNDNYKNKAESSILRVQPQCSWGFGSYASSLSSLCWLLLMPLLVVASLHHAPTTATSARPVQYHAAPTLHHDESPVVGGDDYATTVGLELMGKAQKLSRGGEKDVNKRELDEKKPPPPLL